jgi:thymidylate synthase (FAD)
MLYVPTQWRKAAENVKQGSSDELVNVDQEHINQLMDQCLATYNYLIESGICPEQARAVIPICSETTWIWTGSVAFFARVCKLRLDPHAQKETRDVAQEISALIEPLFPVSWAALMA